MKLTNSFKLAVLGSAVMGMAFSSCSKEKYSYDPTFNQRTLQANWEKVGMGEIDPEQDWNMATQAQADMAIYGMDALSDYKLKLYSSNPLTNPEASLIASVDVKTDANGAAEESFRVDVLKGQTVFYACYENKNRQRCYKAVALIDGKIDATFGKMTTRAAVMTTDGLTIPDVDNPKDQVMARYSEAKVVDSQNSIVNWYYHPDGFAQVLKVEKGQTWTGEISVGASELTLGRTIYVDGTWVINNYEQKIGGTGLVVVREGGKIVVNKDCNLTTDNAGRIVVLEGGSIEGEGSMTFANGTGDAFNYNIGTINIGTMNNNGGNIYNYGEMHIGTLKGGAGYSVYINHSKMFVNNCVYGSTTSNSRILTACQLEVTNDLCCRNISMGPSAYIHVGGNLRMSGSYDGSSDAAELLMASGALLRVDGGVALNNVNMVGPTAASSMAVCEFGKIGDPANICATNFTDNGTNLTAGYVINNLAISIDNPDPITSAMDLYNVRNKPYVCFTTVMMNGRTINSASINGTNYAYATTQNVGNGGAIQVEKGKAPIYIPSDGCCSPGYNGGMGNEETAKPQSFIYACEDLGASDDFDFNDIVFSVSHTNGSTKAYITVMAAGGVLDSYVQYDGEDKGEVHDLLKAQRQSMINTDKSTQITHTAQSVEITVPADWSFVENAKKFTVRVVNGGPSYYVTSPDKKGIAPQMIILPEGWEWPTERTNIKDAYPNFTKWVSDATLTQWNATKVDEKVIKRNK